MPPEPPLNRLFYGHLVLATVVDCLLVVVGLALTAISPWVAALLLISALGLAAHAAHVRRRPGHIVRSGRPVRARVGDRGADWR